MRNRSTASQEPQLDGQPRGLGSAAHSPQGPCAVSAVAPLPPISTDLAAHATNAERGFAHHKIAVALHDIEPATFERCALIRDWLDDHGVDRVTLLVIPARDLHPLGERSPGMTSWLAERRRAGDSIAQHGFQHEQLRRGALSYRSMAHTRRGRTAEFVGLDGKETRRAVNAGWRVLKLAGIEPDGFVAPAYAYTPALRKALPGKFRWWASVMRLHRTLATPDGAPRQPLAPVWGIGTESLLRRTLSPALIRVGSLLCGETMRLDLHPADLEHPRYMMALEGVLSRAGHRREAITYDELIAQPGV
jgi:predicted deacetylase